MPLVSDVMSSKECMKCMNDTIWHDDSSTCAIVETPAALLHNWLTKSVVSLHIAHTWHSQLEL